MARTLFHNGRIYTPIDQGKPLAGKDQGKLQHYEDGALLVRNGEIEDIGVEQQIRAKIADDKHIRKVDCQGQCLIPGFVDPHTHICFAKRREAEFEMRISGTPYLEILEKGGGILSSVRAVAEVSEQELVDSTLKRLNTALQLGTTSIEIKSGYGLDTENELKMLRAIAKLSEVAVQDISATFLGAHAIPPSFKDDPDGFIELIIEEMLPQINKEKLANHCDVFCEKGVFSIAQARRLLQAAKNVGLGVKIHADEVHDLGGAALAAELGAVSADHLLAANKGGLKAMAEACIIANLLPATAYSLQKPYADARLMIDNNLAVALATDCNPGSSFTESMQFVIGLAILNMNMTPAEALVAATLNAAYSIGLADRIGSLSPGKQADFLLLDGETPAIFAYHAGVSSVTAVYKKGSRVFGNH